MKLNGVFGKGTGKVGNSVWAVSGGVQIVRPYNPNVSNPNTDAQIEQRAKLKLMSQIAATLAPAIAFKKQGLVSARNQFISANIGNCTFTDQKAEIDLALLTLTGKNSPLPPIVASFDQNSALKLALESNASANVDAVVYVVCHSNADNKLVVDAIKTVNVAGASGTFNTEIAQMPNSVSVFAYGVKFANASQKVRYENYVMNASGTTGELSVNELEAVKAGEPTMTRYALAEE